MERVPNATRTTSRDSPRVAVAEAAIALDLVPLRIELPDVSEKPALAPTPAKQRVDRPPSHHKSAPRVSAPTKTNYQGSAIGAASRAPDPGPDGLVTGAYVALEAVSAPGHLVRHHAFAGRIDRIGPASSHIDRGDSSFVVRESVVRRRGGDGRNGISLESTNFPGHFLTVECGAIYLRQDAQICYSGSATFLPRQGLTGAELSLETYCHRGMYLRHWGSTLVVQVDDHSPSFARDATFRAVAALA